ncbi:MAG: hypothetical protein L6R37_006347 [Teloschistes peruensis]|nr:MAG: hypothetical protein L6R37_006347 [Teloschistes peruensis]
MAKSLLFTLLACTLQVNAALLPLNHQAIEPRATTPAVPKCTTNSDVVVNGAFFGYPRQSNYDPWTLTTTGSPGCRYLTGYTPCQGFTNGFGDSDPNCLFVLVLRPLGQYQLTRIFSSLCGYGSAGGSTDISQQITYAPGCLYTVEAEVACWGHNEPSSDTNYGTPKVSFRVTLGSTVVIPQQLSCPACTSSSQPGCAGYPYPTYKIVRANVTTPATTSAKFTVSISQGAQSGTVAPLLITAVRMITPGTDQYT